jgi:hypothetical protein
MQVVSQSLHWITVFEVLASGNSTVYRCLSWKWLKIVEHFFAKAPSHWTKQRPTSQEKDTVASQTYNMHVLKNGYLGQDENRGL